MTVIGHLTVHRPKLDIIIPDTTLDQIISDCPATITDIILGRRNWFWDFWDFLDGRMFCPNCQAMLCKVDVIVKIPPPENCIDQQRTVY